MTTLMTQSSLGLTAPSSRQDIISALLNDYGNSFESPSSTFKELPAPPAGDGGKSLPPVMMRFQLRVDEPRSPQSPVSEKNSPTKIVSRSMSRSSKPPSLNLLKSNGATAILPASPPAPPAPPKHILSSVHTPVEDRPLPPPPPEKSERRKTAMGNAPSAPTRRDSKDPEDDHRREHAAPIAPIAPVKRKPLPGGKTFTSLAELGTGPRGRTPVPRQREEARSLSVSSQEDAVPTRREVFGERPTLEQVERPIVKVEETKTEVLLPPPPRKIGLPSNPRARGQGTPANMKHSRGKSSTGLDIMKAASPSSSKAPVINAVPVPNTITPGPTPSPRKIEAIRNGAAVQAPTLARNVRAALESPISPISANEDSHRPFSFEAGSPHAAPQAESTCTESPISPPKSSFPPRTTSRITAPVSEPAAAQPAVPQAHLSSSAQETAQPILASDSPSSSSPQQPFIPTFPSSITADTPFVPLTITPQPQPPNPILPKHRSCYTNHAVLTRYTARFQPPGCMTCHESHPGSRATCVCCGIQLCAECEGELRRIPGRNLAELLHRCGKIEEYEEGDDDNEEVERKPQSEQSLGHASSSEGSSERTLTMATATAMPRPGIVVSDVDEGVDFS